MSTTGRRRQFAATLYRPRAAASARRMCVPGDGDRSMIQGVSVFAIVVVAFIVITVLMGVRQVPQGYNYTVERFGKYNKTLTPGLGLILPYIDSVGHKLNVMRSEE